MKIYDKKFSTPLYEGAWFSFDGDRLSFRKKIEAFLQLEMKDPNGKLEVNETGPHWISSKNIELSYSHALQLALSHLGRAGENWG